MLFRVIIKKIWVSKTPTAQSRSEEPFQRIIILNIIIQIRMLSALLRRLRSSYGFTCKLCGEGANGNKYRKIPQRHHADAIVCTRSLNGASCVPFCIATLGAWTASGQLKRRTDRVNSLAAAAFSARTAHPPRGTNTAVGPQTSCTERLVTNWFGFIKEACATLLYTP